MSAQVSRPGVGRQGALVALTALGLLAACTGEISPFGGSTTGAGGSSATAGPGAGPGAGPIGAGGGAGSGSATGGGGTDTVDPSCVPASVDPADATLRYQCNSCVVPAATPMRRLSKPQFLNALTDLLHAFTDGESVVNGDTGWYLNTWFPKDSPVSPDDKHYANFTNLDQVVQQGHADGIAQIAALVGNRVASNALKRAVGECAVKESDDACLDTFIRTFGERALRRPITDEDVAFYRQPAVKAPYTKDDYADVIALLLSAPESFFLVEKGDQSVTDAVAPLTAYQLASRLSFHFWQTAPDEALYAAAKSGELLTEAGYAAQVDRMFKDERTQVSLRIFFSEWLSNDTLESLEGRLNSQPYDTVRGDFTPTKDTRAHMLDEVTDAAMYYTFGKPASYESFFRSTKSFARTADVAQVYGTPVWDGKSEPQDVPGRAGLITRPALLATGTNGTRPIMKGVFLRKILLCDAVGDPPANAGMQDPAVPYAPEDSTRVHIEKLTGQSPCSSCHATQINPLGFVTEGFDGFGRPRSNELLINDKGQAIAPPAAIDTKVKPHVDEASEDKEISSPQELVSLMADSPKLDACFARQYFRFTFGRIESDQDSCALGGLEKTLRQDSDLATVLRQVALLPSFKTRSFK